MLRCSPKVTFCTDPIQHTQISDSSQRRRAQLAALSLVLHYLWLFSLGKKTNNNNKTTNSLRAFKAHKYNEPEAIWQTCLMAGGHLGPAAVVMLTRLPTSKEYVTCSQSITVTHRSEHFFLFVHPLLHFLPSISLEISFPYF